MCAFVTVTARSTASLPPRELLLAVFCCLNIMDATCVLPALLLEHALLDDAAAATVKSWAGLSESLLYLSSRLYWFEAYLWTFAWLLAVGLLMRPHTVRSLNLGWRTNTLLVALIVSNIGLWVWCNAERQELFRAVRPAFLLAASDAVLGAQLADLASDFPWTEDGVLVKKGAGGLQAGDVIVTLAGFPVEDALDLLNQLEHCGCGAAARDCWAETCLQPGDEVSLGVLRPGLDPASRPPLIGLDVPAWPSRVQALE